jgi:hypothetical protein
MCSHQDRTVLAQTMDELTPDTPYVIMMDEKTVAVSQ